MVRDIVRRGKLDARRPGAGVTGWPRVDDAWRPSCCPVQSLCCFLAVPEPAGLAALFLGQGGCIVLPFLINPYCAQVE